MLKKRPYHLLLIPVLGFFFVHVCGCAKEYSFEGADTLVQPGLPDPAQPDPVIPFLPFCTSCDSNASVAEWKWDFRTGNSFVCGDVDTAIINIERTTFTFFGPSSCSLDSGMVISVYLSPEKLDRDRTNLTSDRIAFYYYDNVSPSYIFMSQQGTGFSLIIDRYTHQTRLATGRFHGFAYKANGEIASIHSGRFNIKLQ